MINVLNKHKDNIPSNSIYIGRGSPLGNIYTHINTNHKDALFKTSSREESIYKYEKYLINQILLGNPNICHAINDLIIKYKRGEDINLICFCSPLKCHGEVIKRVVEEAKYCINWFSNMRRMDSPIIYQNIKYWTVENFYQAMKIDKNNIDYRQKIAIMNPFHAKKEGQKILLDINKWEEIKIKVMKKALFHKFHPTTSWGEKLRLFNDEIIEWNNWGDKFWGKCIFSLYGENILGKLLTEIKNEKYQT